MTAVDLLHAQLLADGEDPTEMVILGLETALCSLANVLGVLDGKPDQNEYLRSLLEMHDKEDDHPTRLAAMLVTASGWIYGACSGEDDDTPEQVSVASTTTSPLAAVQVREVTNLNAPPLGCVRGLDGKTYPTQPLHPDDLDHLVGRVHYLSHDEHLSVRQIVARLDIDHGVRRSVGTVHSWLRTSICDACVQVAPTDTPEQRGGGAT